MKHVLEKYDVFNELTEDFEQKVDMFLDDFIGEKISFALKQKNEEYRMIDEKVNQLSECIFDAVGWEVWREIERYVYYIMKMQDLESYACFFAGMRFQKEYLE
jgi:hypothetical protein